MSESITIINQFFYPDLDADAQFAYDFAKGLVKKGYEVRVICQGGFKNINSSNNDIKKKVAINSIEVHRLTDAFSNKTLFLKFLRHSLFYFTLFFKLINFTSKDSLLLVISNPPYSGFITALIKSFKNIRYFFAVKDVYPDIMVSHNIIKNNGLIYHFLNWATKFSYRYADRVFSLGPYMSNRIKDKGICEDKIVEIPNWGFDELYPLNKKENPLIEKFNLKDKFVVLYSGNHGYGHEFETLLLGAERLSGEYDDIYFVFIGGGARFNEIQEFKKSNPDAHLLAFDYLPFEQLNYGLNLADISLVTMEKGWQGVSVPSKTYGIMAVGSPIVYVGPASDTSWTIKKHNCGFIVNNGSVDEFVKRIKELYHNEVLRKEMGERARRGYEEGYTRKKVIERYLSLMNST